MKTTIAELARRKKLFKETCEQDCKRMTHKNNVAWAKLSLYLKSEYDEGKAEFRLLLNSDKSFYIHPVVRNGKTFDGKL